MYEYIYIRNFGTLSLIFLRTRTVRTNAKEVDRGRPSGHSRRGLGAIRAVCRAWHALKVVSAGADKAICRAFFLRRYFDPGITLHCSKCWRFLLISTISSEAAWLATTLGSLRRDRLGVHYHSTLGALRAVCCVTRACAVCNAMFLLTKKEQAAGPNSLLGATLSWRTRFRAPASVLMSLFFTALFLVCLLFFLVFHFQMFVFSPQNIALVTFITTLVPIYLLYLCGKHGSPQLLPSLCRYSFHVLILYRYCHHVPCVTRACTVCRVS